MDEPVRGEVEDGSNRRRCWKTSESKAIFDVLLADFFCFALRPLLDLIFRWQIGGS
jgi:hypothetical protein